LLGGRLVWSRADLAGCERLSSLTREGHRSGALVPACGIETPSIGPGALGFGQGLRTGLLEDDGA